MKFKILTLALTCLFLSNNTFSKEVQVQPTTVSEVSTKQQLPQHVLFYGKVTKIIKDDNNEIKKIVLKSEHLGEYVMNISDKTFWLDSGNKRAISPNTLEIGEEVYAFHSPAVTRSLPPQTTAIAIVRNVPQDAMVAQLHTIEGIEKNENGIDIITNNGGLIISTNEETTFSPYMTRNLVGAEDLKENNLIFAWYSVVATSYPAKTYTKNIMILPEIN